MDLACPALFAGLYPRAVDGDLSVDEALLALVQALHVELDARMVTVAERRDHGVLALRASSREGALWLELHRMPQRWEGTVTAQGSAARALRCGGYVAVPLSDPGLEPWRRAAREDGVEMFHALRFDTPDRIFVLEICTAEAVAWSPETTEALSGLLVRFRHLLAQMAGLQRQRLLASALESAGNPAFITDAHGTIVWVNQALCERSGYPADQLVGDTPRILQSGAHHLRYYRELWRTIRSGEVWRGETIDRDRQGRRYVVYQTISPVSGFGGKRHYLSMNVDATLEHERRVALEQAAGVVGREGLLTAAAFAKAVDSMLSMTGEGALLLLSAKGLRQQLEAVDAPQREAIEQQMNSWLHRALAEADLLARLAPDEFAAFLADMASVEVVLERLHTVSAGFGDEEVMHGSPLCVRIGYALSPDDGVCYDRLYAAADRALANDVVWARRGSR